MAAKLKVYRAEIGGAHEWVVAATSQKAAAEIWGTDIDVFREGRGGPTTKPELVKAAMEEPGVPQRRVLGGKGPFKPIPKTGDVETWKLALKAMGITGKRPPPPKPAKPEKPKPEPKPKKAEKPKPDRSKLDAAEASLRAFEAEMKRLKDEMASERASLERRHAQKRDALDAELKALRTRRDEARKAFAKGK